MKRDVKEAIGDLGHEEPPESPIAKLGQAQPSPEEMEPEEFDAREYMTGSNDLGAYLEPNGFARHDVREGVVTYTLQHVPLEKPLRFVDNEDAVHQVVWANVHVRFDKATAIPFWRVLVSPGHEASFYTDLQMVKIVRLDPETAGSGEWIPNAVAAAKKAVEVIQQPCQGHLAYLTFRLKQEGFKPFNR